MRNRLPESCREGLRMIVLVSLIVLLRGFPCFHDFLHGASLSKCHRTPLCSHMQKLTCLGPAAHSTKPVHKVSYQYSYAVTHACIQEREYSGDTVVLSQTES